MATALVLQHLEPEGPGLIGVVLRNAGVEVRIHRSDLDGEPSSDALDAADAVVVMGGTMDAHRDEGFPTRQAELALLRTAVEREVPVLGICLGAQLLAIAGGGTCFPGPHGPEVGWAPVRLSADAGGDPLLGRVEEPFVALHWHGDTFDLPPGAVHLASSDVYPNQAFRLGPAAWGLQFHLEADRSVVDAFASSALADGEDPAVVEPIVAEADARLAALAPVCDVVLGRFAALVAAR